MILCHLVGNFKFLLWCICVFCWSRFVAMCVNVIYWIRYVYVIYWIGLYSAVFGGWMQKGWLWKGPGASCDFLPSLSPPCKMAGNLILLVVIPEWLIVKNYSLPGSHNLTGCFWKNVSRRCSQTMKDWFFFNCKNCHSIDIHNEHHIASDIIRWVHAVLIPQMKISLTGTCHFSHHKHSK